MAGLILSNRTDRKNRPNNLYRDPFSALARDFFSWEPLTRGTAATAVSTFAPRFNVTETATAFVAEADLPGVAEENVEVTLDGRQLTVSGTRESREETEGDKFHIVERRVGSFSRSFTLPDTIDSENITADLSNGVLTVTIAKAPEVLPRKIPVAASK